MVDIVTNRTLLIPGTSDDIFAIVFACFGGVTALGAHVLWIERWHWACGYYYCPDVMVMSQVEHKGLASRAEPLDFGPCQSMGYDGRYTGVALNGILQEKGIMINRDVIARTTANKTPPSSRTPSDWAFPSTAYKINAHHDHAAAQQQHQCCRPCHPDMPGQA